MEILKHECGVAMVRLLKPLEYYEQKYGTMLVGLNKLYLMMEKQHNRGQEGAGLACVKLDAPAGTEYLHRERALGNTAIQEIFGQVHRRLAIEGQERLHTPQYAKEQVPFIGQVYMGHLRYSTTGKSGLSYVHPFLRRQPWRATSLCVCGNFNLTNTDEVFRQITAMGQHPRFYADTHIMLEQLGHRLDRENERLYAEARGQGLEGQAVTDYIEAHLDMNNMWRSAAPLWDGGYVICAMTGSGEMSVLRDPWGIRPAFWYMNDELMVLASERPVIQTTLAIEADEVQELKPGQSITLSRSGRMRLEQIIEPKRYAACSFERIYFSRGSDCDIYRERKALGAQLLEPILKAVDGDLDHCVFSFIPNTAESAFYGMTEAFNDYLNKKKIDAIEHLNHRPTDKELAKILRHTIRTEKVAWKDIKMRTFITEQGSRNDLAAHVYDITYGSIEPYVDSLVVIDDSIVRGTTLRESIIRILDRLHPRRIVFVSSSPQIRYADYYGIDMSRMEEFIAFRAAIELLRERGLDHIIIDTYHLCKAQVHLPKEEQKNYVKNIYAPFSDDDISGKIAQMLRAPGIEAEVVIVYQTLEGLHRAVPNHPGDWYFSGDYPTAGGNRNVCQAYINFIENIYLKESQEKTIEWK